MKPPFAKGEEKVKLLCLFYQSGAGQNPALFVLRINMKRVDVVAAVLNRDGKFFIAQRPHGGQLGGLWEFPGGKVEEGETHETALKREMMEEFEAEISVGEYVASTQHTIAGRIVCLHFYRSELISDNFKVVEHADSAWCSLEDMNDYELAPADLDILPFLA